MINLKKTVLTFAASAMIFATQGANVLVNTPSGFQALGMSPNGKWACGVYVDATGTTIGFKWNLESGAIEMLDFNECVGWDISNDGVVSGDFTDTTTLGGGISTSLPGIHRDGKWHSLEMPEGNVSDGIGGCISPDGHYTVGAVAVDGTYRSHIWKDGKIVKSLESPSHGIASAVSPDGTAAGGWIMQYNRTACYWGPDGKPITFEDSPEMPMSPWNYSRNFSPDGSKLVYWGGWEFGLNSMGGQDLYLWCIYDTLTGQKTRIKTFSPSSTLEFYDISNNATLVGNDYGRGVVVVDGKCKYIDDYLADRDVNISRYEDFYFGTDGYVGVLPIFNVVSISEDENTLLCTYYNTIGQPASLAIKMEQDITNMPPVQIKGEQLNGVNTACITWRQPVGISGLRGYNIYRDGKKLNLLPLTTQYYYDKKLAEGSYEYVVSTVVNSGIETKAEAISVDINPSKLPAPLQAFARGRGANSAAMQWLAPMSNLIHKTYYNPDATDLRGFMVYDEIDFEAAVRFSRAELQCYEGYQISEVSFVPLGEHTGWKINIYSRSASGNISLLKSIPLNDGDLNYGTINTIKLDSPLAIPSADVIVAVQVSVNPDLDNLIGAERGPVNAGYSDLIRIVGEPQFTSAYESSLEGGWYVYCMSWAIDLGLKSPNSDNVNVAGYTVYVDGEKDGETTDTNYLVRNLTEGAHDLSVEAIYTDGTTSDLASTSVNINGVYPGVEHVAVEVEKEAPNSVTASWETPVDFDNTIITYARENDTMQGIRGPAEYSYAMLAGVSYPSTYLRSYGGYKVDAFRFYPLCDAIFTFMLYENNHLICELEVEDFEINQWNSVELPEEIILKENHDYFLALDCFDPEPDTPILPIDNTVGVPYASELYSTDGGETWNSMTIETGTHGNWLMGMTVSATDAITYDVDGYDVVVDGTVANNAIVDGNTFTYNFNEADENLHSLRVDTYYPTRPIAVEGGETHFHIRPAGIDLITVAGITLQSGPNYLIVDGLGVENVTLVNIAGQTVASVNGNKVNITDLQAGVYVARITANGHLYNSKIRIMH